MPINTSGVVTLKPYRSTRHAIVSTYKNHVLLHLPPSPDTAQWLDPAEALALAAQLRSQAKQQIKIDRWLAKYEPKSYDGKQALTRLRKARRK